MLATTTTAGGGFYQFDGLPAGNYIVLLPSTNFNPGGVLRDYRSSTGPLPTVAYEPAPDPNTNKTDSDDNGTEANGLLGLGGYIQSAPIALAAGAQQSSSNATGTTVENRLDFGVNSLPQIDLAVTVTDNQASYDPGGTLNYVVVVTNSGPADADGMSVVGTRPAGITSWTWTCDAGTPAAYNCTSDATNPATFSDTLNLPQLASVTYHVSAQVATSATGPLATQVYVVPPSGMSDLTNGNNVATDTDQRTDKLDVSVTVTDGVATYAPGATLTYTVVVANSGPGDAVGVGVSASRPAQIASWSWACAVGTPVGYNCTGNAGNPATFSDSVDLPQGASVSYVVTAHVAPDAAGTLTHTVGVTAPSGFVDPALGNNSAADFDVPQSTTLTIVKTASSATVVQGASVTYTIQVTNTGSVNAGTVVVTDVLPGPMLFESVSGSGWACGVVYPTVTCSMPLLAPGAAAPIVITARTGSSGDVVNTVTTTAVNASAATSSAQTEVRVQVIPTTSPWGLLLLTLMLAAAARAVLRRI